jgi:hypothetical protein
VSADPTVTSGSSPYGSTQTIVLWPRTGCIIPSPGKPGLRLGCRLTSAQPRPSRDRSRHLIRRPARSYSFLHLRQFLALAAFRRRCRSRLRIQMLHLTVGFRLWLRGCARHDVFYASLFLSSSIFRSTPIEAASAHPAQSRTGPQYCVTQGLSFQSVLQGRLVCRHTVASRVGGHPMISTIVNSCCSDGTFAAQNCDGWPRGSETCVAPVWRPARGCGVVGLPPILDDANPRRDASLVLVCG